MPGILYIVATPLGNLEDITFRAVRVLREVAAIACEDTRQSQKLLKHFEISKPLESYHDFNEREKTAQLVSRLLGGDHIALISDAGTPLISDPGFRLVHDAIACGVRVVPIPGPAAVTAALSASGLATNRFLFLGFLPPKSGQRRKALEALKTAPDTLVLYEAPHRVLECLADLAAVFGPRPAVAAREMSKIHEEFIRGTLISIRADLARRPSIKGEFTLIIGTIGKAAEGANGGADEDDLAVEVTALIEQGEPRMDAIKAVAKRHGLSKAEVYEVFVASKDGAKDDTDEA